MTAKGRKGKSDTIKKCAVICGIIYACIGFLIRVGVEDPYTFIHTLGAGVYMPPLWIFNLLSIFWYFVSGAAAGIVIGRVACGRLGSCSEKNLYRGSMFFIVLFFLSLLWYPIFFDMKLFFSLLIALLTLACCIFCAIFWRTLSAFVFLMLCTTGIWQFYVLLLNLSVIFGN